MITVRVASRLPWNRSRREVRVPAGSTALAVFRSAGFEEKASQVLFIINGVVCLDEEALADGAELEVFVRMHGG